MRVFYQKQGRGLHAAVRFASVNGPLDTVALYKTERDARRFVEAANRSMDIEEEKQALAKIDPSQEHVKAPHGWVCFNSGPTEWFWSEEREALEHELSDDIRPATHLEKYFFNKQSNQTHEHDTPSPQTNLDVFTLTDDMVKAAILAEQSGSFYSDLARMRAALMAALSSPSPQTKMTGDFLKPSTTARGFGLLTFTDRNGTECTLQESSLATEAAIWLGAAKLEVKRFPGDYTGWHNVDFAALLPGQDIVGNERMHLTQDHVSSLLPALQHFAETGELPTSPSPSPKMDGEVDPWVIIEKLRIQHRDEIHNVWMPLVAELRKNHSIQANSGGEDLAPCPFCGGDSGFLCPGSQPQDGTWKAYCRECKSEGKWADTKVEAAAFWNNRPLSEADLVSYDDVYRALNDWSKDRRILDDVAPIARKIVALFKKQSKEA